MNSYVGYPFNNPTVLSYCPGILGLERGLRRALGSIRTVAYVEIEAFIIENLLAGMEAGLVDAAPIWSNLKTFDAKPFRGLVDIIIGGYPCQPFSTAGGRKGTDDPRHLYPYLERDIKAIRPVCCFFENVSGHLSLGFDQVWRSLSDMGYAVEAGIFTAEEVGAPHERERLFILAIRKDWLAHAKSSGIRGITGDIHQKNGRQDIGLSFKSNCAGGKVVRGVGQANASHDRQDGRETNDIKPVGRIRKGEQRGELRSESGGCSELGNSEGIISGGLPIGTGAEFTRSEKSGKEVAYTHVNAAGRSPGSVSSESGTTEGAESRQDGQRSGDEPGNDGKGVAHSDSAGLPQFGNDGEPTEKDNNRVGYTSECAVTVGLADSNGTGCQEQRQSVTAGQEHPAPEYVCADRWPARPGEPQHEWEEPRTIITDAAARLLGGYGKKHPESFQQWQIEQVAFDGFTGTIKPEMGSSVDGYSFREDFLRALGNSVVEQTAEIAFKELLRKHLDKSA